MYLIEEVTRDDLFLTSMPDLHRTSHIRCHADTRLNTFLTDCTLERNAGAAQSVPFV